MRDNQGEAEASTLRNSAGLHVNILCFAGGNYFPGRFCWIIKRGVGWAEDGAVQCSQVYASVQS